MRVTPIVPALLLLVASVPARAQEPIDYVGKLDYFSINFPGQPKVEETTYPDEYRLAPLPARAYTADQGRNHYKVTVVDYRGVPKMHAARNQQCIHDAGADKPGLTPQARRDLIGDTCQDETVKDIRGAMMWATWNIIERAAKVTYLAHYNVDVIEGHEVHTINPDESRTYGAIHMYENRLYIIETTVPKNAPAANWFQISLRMLDENYKPVRYQYSGLMMYANGYPKPPLANQGGQGAQGQAAQGQGR
jgi:hypothetical protein